MSLKRFISILTILLLLTLGAHSQLYKFSGLILDNKKDPLPLASVEVKEVQKGLITREDGSFEFYLEKGKYDLVVSMVGFKTKTITFMVNESDTTAVVNLDLDESSNLSEVVIRVKPRDRSEEYIKNVIRNKDAIQAAMGAYSCNMYIKAFQQDSSDLHKNKGKGVDAKAPENLFNGMSLAEISLHYNQGSGGQVREERLGVKKSGRLENLFYLTATDGDFNIYNNFLKAPAISPLPFISPISYSGLIAYRFKMMKIERKDGRKIYTIAIRPRQLSNATVEGELVIMDSLWVVLRSDFTLPQAHTPEYDYFEVSQQYNHVGDSAWVLGRQQFTYDNKIKGGKRNGQTTVIYSDYELQKSFPRGFFGNEVSTTTDEAYTKDSTYWSRIRVEPLTTKEYEYSKYEDSLYKVTHTEAYLDSLDRVMNHLTWKKALFFGQMFNDHKKERTWLIPPLPFMYQPFQFGGGRLVLAGIYKKIYPDRKTLSLDLRTSYGFRNHDVNGSFTLKRRYNPITGGNFSITVGREFQYIFDGDAWINLLKRSNIYLNNSVEVTHGIVLPFGFYLTNTVEAAFRRSVSNYRINPKADSLFGGILADNGPVAFQPYNAFYSKVKLEYTPGQKYRREPHEKIVLGSKWPTFYAIWKKGIPGILKSKIDFDYLEFGIQQKLNLGTAGMLSYTIKTGDFLNQTDLRLIDYEYQRKGDPLFFNDPNHTFQALDSSFAVFNRFYQGNFLHEFNGALINKIPFLKKLKLQEVAGAGFLIAKERDLKYGEIFGGLERVFRWPLNPLTKLKLGFYVVGSTANKFSNPIQFKIGIKLWDWQRNRWL